MFGPTRAASLSTQDLNSKEVPPNMKKLLTLLATLAVAVSLSMPVFAQESQEAQGAPQSAPAQKQHKKKKAKKHKESKKKKSKKGATEPAPGQ